MAVACFKHSIFSNQSQGAVEEEHYNIESYFSGHSPEQSREETPGTEN
jgi:hypothetical protein